MKKRWRTPARLSFLAVGMSVLLFVCAVSAVLIFEFPSVIGAERLLPIYSVERDDKKIAVSFDAAWGNEHTKAILDSLDAYHVKATFFLVNFWAEKFPEDVKEIAARGHEVENHSATHPDLASLSADQIKKELNTAGNTIEKLCGKRPDLIRPPFGSYNNTVIEAAEQEGYRVIQWDVDSLDWKTLSTEQIVERVTRNVKPGSIVLFHNNAEHVEEYLPVILEKLQSSGYEIVPVGELIYRESYHMDHTGRQIPEESGSAQEDGAAGEAQSGENGAAGNVKSGEDASAQQ